MKEAAHRRDAEAAGRWAENVAVLWLGLKGYRLLIRRAKTPVGEIDLIVRRGRTVAFVEVKARATPAAALASIHPAQRRRIERAALWFLANQRYGDADYRFDVVAISPRHLPRHLANAWAMGE